MVASDQHKDFIKRIPEQPGVYKYFNTQNELIYIGKAKNLKKRVSSYFNKNHYDSQKTAMLVSRINRIEYTLVDSEIDALLLENSLIKKYQPRFNINLKDDKTYPFICIKNEPFPRILVTRKMEKDGSDYFGPYANGNMMHAVLDLIKTLFPTRTCNYHLSDKNIEAKKFKACLEYQLGNCLAPCVGYQSTQQYQNSIKEIKHILKGNLSVATVYLKQAMQQAASELNFEAADTFKKKLEALDKYQSKSTIVSKSIHNVDVFSIVSDEKFAFLNYLKVANGIIIQTQTFEVKKKLGESDEAILELAIAEVRHKYGSTSKELVLPFKPDTDFEDILVTVPKAGDKKLLLDLSFKNAMYYKRDKLAQYDLVNPELRTERLLAQMQKDLRLTQPPAHIECFDNSNIQGAHAVSACVVFKNAKPSKADYRHFNVKTVVGPDDFATMREVVYRRYARVIEEQGSLPDLIVIDGGKGQLSAAIESLVALNIYGKVPVVGIAKRLEEIFYPEDELPLFIDKKSETLKVIQHIRDEAHRFGITHHRNKRSKSAITSQLEQIKGIGPETVSALLKAFKSVTKIKKVEINELSTVVGVAKAKIIHSFFNN